MHVWRRLGEEMPFHSDPSSPIPAYLYSLGMTLLSFFFDSYPSFQHHQLSASFPFSQYLSLVFPLDPPPRPLGQQKGCCVMVWTPSEPSFPFVSVSMEMFPSPLSSLGT